MPALDRIEGLPQIARQAVVQIGLDADTIKDVTDKKAVSLLQVCNRSKHFSQVQDALKSCSVKVKPSDFKKLKPWTQDTKAVSCSGWEALARKYQSDTFMLQEKCAASAFNDESTSSAARAAARQDPVFRRAYTQGGLFLEVRIALASIAKYMGEQSRKRRGIVLINTPKNDFSIIMNVRDIKVLEGPDGPEPLIEVAFAYKDVAHCKNGPAAEPQMQTVLRLKQQADDATDFGLNLETEETTDSARLLAFILTQNSKMLPEAHAKAQMKKWDYCSTDAKILTPSFLLPMRMLKQRKARGLEKTALTCAECDQELTASAPVCAACRVVHYCNKDCQKAHWPQHKQTCSKPTTDVADFSSRDVALVKNVCPPGMEGLFHATVSFSRPDEGGSKHTKLGSPLPAMPPSGFIVKVQIPMLPGQESAPSAQAMIYPRQKRFTMVMARDQPDYSRLCALIRQRGFAGAKMYLYAKRVDEFTLLMHLQTFPSQDQSW